MQNQTSNIVKYKKKKQLNIGVIIFGFILVYLVATIAMYITKPKISVYEVRQGSILKDTDYTALAIREEKVISSSKAGFVNYYIPNTSKVRLGTQIYSLSREPLELKPTTANKELALSPEEQYEIYREIQDFSNRFKETKFEDTYLTKGNIEEVLQDISNQSRVDLIKTQLQDGILTDTKLYGAKDDGIIVYSVDGLENIKIDTVTPEHLIRENYNKMEFSNNMQVKKGDSLYKLVTSESWKLYFEVSKETCRTLSGKKSVKVRFKEDEQVMWAGLKLKQESGKYYATLSLENGMIRYVNDRFLDIELILEDETGLKIPKSAEVTKEFYVVPKTYITQGGNSNSEGVLRRTIDKKGKEITEFLITNIYYQNEEVAYLDPNAFSKSDILIKPNSNETFALKEKGKLKGVYQVNKGYAVFKQIQILCESDEYYIVKVGSDYGLSNYDHIVLDGKSVKENDLVF